MVLMMTYVYGSVISRTFTDKICLWTRLTNAQWNLVHRLTCTEPGKVQPTCCQTDKMQPDKWLHAYAGRWQQGQLAVPMEEWQCALAAETAHHAARAAKRFRSRWHFCACPPASAYTSHSFALAQPTCNAQDNRSCWFLVSSGACLMFCSIFHQAMLSLHAFDIGQI